MLSWRVEIDSIFFHKFLRLFQPLIVILDPNFEISFGDHCWILFDKPSILLVNLFFLFADRLK